MSTRRSRGSRGRGRGRAGRGRSRKLCKFYGTEKGCRFGDKCRFSHNTNFSQRVKEMEAKTWWRKCMAPMKKPKKTMKVYSPADVTGSFTNQLMTLLVMPRRVRSQINTIASLVADLVRSYIPVSAFHREVSLTGLLGNLHEWPLVVIQTCPATSRVIVGGLNTPLIVIDEGSSEPRWLCGPTWKSNGLPKYNSQFNSARITSIDISDTGVILFSTYCTVQADDPDLDPRGLYAVDLDSKAHKLRIVEDGNRVSLLHCDITLAPDGRSLYIVQAGSTFQPALFFEVEFDESNLDQLFKVKKKISVDAPPANYSIIFLKDDLFLLMSTRHGGSEAVFLNAATGDCVKVPLNMDILGFTKCRDNSLLLHSIDQIRVTSKQTFLESISEGKLKERLQVQSHKLYQKDILIDLPLLCYDSRNQQIITDTGARVLSWIDVY